MTLVGRRKVVIVSKQKPFEVLLEDLKGVVVFLSSAASDYMTGGVLFVDGGYRAM